MVSKTALTEYDFQVLLDRSGSMGEPVSATNRTSRWDATRETIISFARELEAIDDDGLGLITFGAGPITVLNGAGVDEVRDAMNSMRPGGSTPLAQALEQAVALAGRSNKRDFIMVFTDGVPNDTGAVESVIRQAANAQTNDADLTFLFIQVGDDQSATRWLQSLDDQLTGVKFDIVDVKTIDQVNDYTDITDLILHAISD